MIRVLRTVHWQSLYLHVFIDGSLRKGFIIREDRDVTLITDHSLVRQSY